MYHKNKIEHFLVNNLDKSSSSKSSDSNTSETTPPITPPIITINNINNTYSLNTFQNFLNLQKKTNTTRQKYIPNLKYSPELIYNPLYYKLLIDKNNTKNQNPNINDTDTSLQIENYINKYFNISKKFLKSNVHPDTIKAIIVPYSTIKESGLCCASSYYQVYNRTVPIKKIILLCTHNIDTNTNNNNVNNSVNFISTSFTHIKSYKNGNDNTSLKIDNVVIESLKPYLEINNEHFENEMSLLSNLPFIETIAPQASLIPILISNKTYLDNTNLDKINNIIHILKKIMKNEDTIVICISNLTAFKKTKSKNDDVISEFNDLIDENSQIITNCNIKNQDNTMLQFIYNTINGVKTRSSKIDDILFIQNTPSNSTMNLYFFSQLLNNYIDISKQSYSSSSSISSEDSGISVNFNNTQNILYSRITSYYTSNYKSNYNSLISGKDINIEHFLPQQLLNNTVHNTIDSYIGLIFTSKPYIDNSNLRALENSFTEYEKIALISFIKEQFYLNLIKTKNVHNMNNMNNMNHIDRYKCNITNINNMPINTPMFKTHLGVFITIVDKNNNLRGCIGTSETNNDEYTIENNIKRFVLELSTKETKCRDLIFQPITLDEINDTINNLTFNINILYHMKSINIDKYYSNQFKFGDDGLLFQSLVNVDNKHNNKCKYSLTSISKYFNNHNNYNNIDNNSNNVINNTIENVKKQFLNELLNNINDSHQNNFKLFYNEGLLINTNFT